MNTETEAVMDKIVLVPAVIMVLAVMETIILVLVHIEEEDSMNLIYKKIVPKIDFHVSHNI